MDVTVVGSMRAESEMATGCTATFLVIVTAGDPTSQSTHSGPSKAALSESEMAIRMQIYFS